MPDFHAAKPDKDITDPNNLRASGTLPAMVYRFTEHAGDAIVVAWAGKLPIYNDMLRVTDADTLAARIAEGWAPAPQLSSAGAPKKKA